MFWLEVILLSGVRCNSNGDVYYVSVVDIACSVVLNCICSGNEYLHDLTSQANYTLRFDLEDFEDASRYAVYSHFAVASEADKYRMSVGGYNGTAGDFVHTCKLYI